MREVQEEELSALLDGELDPQRVNEVRTLIQSDPGLRMQLDALTKLDARLRRLGKQAAFSPDVSFSAEGVSETPAWQWLTGTAVVLLLITVRLLPKLVELSLFGLALQLAACAAMVFIIIRMAREAEPSRTPTLGAGGAAQGRMSAFDRKRRSSVAWKNVRFWCRD